MINFKTIQQSSIILIVTFLCAFSISAYATEFHVTTSQELQTALSTAAENNQSDSIFLAAGTYKGNFRFETEESDTSISIQAEEGLNAGNVILDGEERDRVLSINSGENKVNVSIDQLTIQNGNTTNMGAGIHVEIKGELSIINCNVKNNLTKHSYDVKGSGLYINSCSKISINKTTISNNTLYATSSYSKEAIGSGLYIYAVDGDVFIQNNDISGNNSNAISGSRGRSSAMYINCQNLDLQHNRIYNNVSSDNYFCFVSAKNTQIYNNFISNNSATSNGFHIGATDLIFSQNNLTNNEGGFHCSVSNSTIMKSNFFCNNDKHITYVGSKLMTVLNNIFIKNTNESTSSKGCSLYVVSSGNINVINNTLSRNTTKGQGGGLYIDINNSTATLNLYNNIIWGNTAETGGADIYLNGYGSKKNFYNNNVHDIVGTFDFAANNIDVAPLFINTEKDDFHLGAGSLCINAGTNEAPELPAIDMDGNPRIGDDIVDIGAYEHSSTDYHPADTNNDWSLSSEEVSAYETAWKNGNTWSTGPSQIPMNYLTRAGFIHQSGSAYKNAGGAKPLCWIPVE
jgi:hypothetical protein